MARTSGIWIFLYHVWNVSTDSAEGSMILDMAKMRPGPERVGGDEESAVMSMTSNENC